jgi:hypothetical protein
VVAVTTATSSVVERKVPLPDRWLKGFGEVQTLARRMRPVAELAGCDAQRFVMGIPRSPGQNRSQLAAAARRLAALQPGS